MNNEPKRLSLDQFKAKSTTVETQKELEKISGGVLGACHIVCQTTENRLFWYGIDITWLIPTGKYEN